MPCSRLKEGALSSSSDHVISETCILIKSLPKYLGFGNGVLIEHCNGGGMTFISSVIASSANMFSMVNSCVECSSTKGFGVVRSSKLEDNMLKLSSLFTYPTFKKLLLSCCSHESVSSVGISLMVNTGWIGNYIALSLSAKSK